MKSFRLRNGELVLPSQRITPGTSTLVIRLVDHELSDDGDGGDVVFHDKAKRTQQGDLLG